MTPDEDCSLSRVAAQGLAEMKNGAGELGIALWVGCGCMFFSRCCGVVGAIVGTACELTPVWLEPSFAPCPSGQSL